MLLAKQDVECSRMGRATVDLTGSTSELVLETMPLCEELIVLKRLQIRTMTIRRAPRLGMPAGQ